MKNILKNFFSTLKKTHLYSLDSFKNLYTDER